MTCLSNPTLQQIMAAAKPGRCAFCRRALRKDAPPHQRICTRRSCTQRYDRLYQAQRRPASKLTPVVAVTRDLDCPRRRMVRLRCGCRLSVPASRVRQAMRCPIPAVHKAMQDAATTQAILRKLKRSPPPALARLLPPVQTPAR